MFFDFYFKCKNDKINKNYLINNQNNNEIKFEEKINDLPQRKCNNYQQEINKFQNIPITNNNTNNYRNYREENNKFQQSIPIANNDRNYRDEINKYQQNIPNTNNNKSIPIANNNKNYRDEINKFQQSIQIKNNNNIGNLKTPIVREMNKTFDTKISFHFKEIKKSDKLNEFTNSNSSINKNFYQISKNSSKITNLNMNTARSSNDIRKK